MTFIVNMPFYTRVNASIIPSHLFSGVFCPFTSKLMFNSVVQFPYSYILTSFYTKYDPTHFFINTCSLLSVLLPKLPQFHGVRIFGINKYWQTQISTVNTGLLNFCCLLNCLQFGRWERSKRSAQLCFSMKMCLFMSDIPVVEFRCVFDYCQKVSVL